MLKEKCLKACVVDLDKTLILNNSMDVLVDKYLVLKLVDFFSRVISKLTRMLFGVDVYFIIMGLFVGIYKPKFFLEDFSINQEVVDFVLGRYDIVVIVTRSSDYVAQMFKIDGIYAVQGLSFGSLCKGGFLYNKYKIAKTLLDSNDVKDIDLITDDLVDSVPGFTNVFNEKCEKWCE